MTITLPLPEALERTMRPSQAKLHLAIGAFAAEEVTLGQAAEIAGVSQAEMRRELARRRIQLHYGREEFTDDLRSIAELNAKLGA
jgi:predicted HTH domain antitoxin